MIKIYLIDISHFTNDLKFDFLILFRHYNYMFNV